MMCGTASPGLILRAVCQHEYISQYHGTIRYTVAGRPEELIDLRHQFLLGVAGWAATIMNNVNLSIIYFCTLKSAPVPI